MLGPTLFNLYIRGLTLLNITGKIISYADDTVYIFGGSSWENVRLRAANEIGKVKEWLDFYKLSLNISKTKYMAFSKTIADRPVFQNIQTRNLNEPILETKDIKYLGVHIDNNLKWEPHINFITKKLRYLVYKFYLLRQSLNEQLLLMLYYSLVESILRYGIIIWGGFVWFYSRAIESYSKQNSKSYI